MGNEGSTIELDNQSAIMENKFAHLVPKEGCSEVENVQTKEVVTSDDQGVNSAIKEESDSHPLQKEEFLDEFSFMLQKEILENELQEISIVLGEEDKQIDMLNEELQIITSEPKYEEQFERVLKDINTAMLFEEALKDLMEEVQEESFPKLFQDKQVAARGMIHYQLRPLDALLDELQADSTIQLDDQCVAVSDSFAYLAPK